MNYGYRKSADGYEIWSLGITGDRKDLISYARNKRSAQKKVNDLYKNRTSGNPRRRVSRVKTRRRARRVSKTGSKISAALRRTTRKGGRSIFRRVFRKQIRSALTRYRQFHERVPTAVHRVSFTMPRALVHVGRALDISYLPSRNSGKQTRKGRMSSYKHNFGAGVQVYAHPNGRSVIVMGGNFRVSDWLRG